MRKSQWKVLRLAVLAGLLVVNTIPASGAGDAADRPGVLTAKIELPRPGTVTGNWIAVDGTVGGSSARRPWLALRVADLYWPKEEAIVQDGRLRGVVIEAV